MGAAGRRQARSCGAGAPHGRMELCQRTHGGPPVERPRRGCGWSERGWVRGGFFATWQAERDAARRLAEPAERPLRAARAASARGPLRAWSGAEGDGGMRGAAPERSEGSAPRSSTTPEAGGGRPAQRGCRSCGARRTVAHVPAHSSRGTSCATGRLTEPWRQTACGLPELRRVTAEQAPAAWSETGREGRAGCSRSLSRFSRPRGLACGTGARTLGRAESSADFGGAAWERPSGRELPACAAAFGSGAGRSICFFFCNIRNSTHTKGLPRACNSTCLSRCGYRGNARRRIIATLRACN